MELSRVKVIHDQIENSLRLWMHCPRCGSNKCRGEEEEEEAIYDGRSEQPIRAGAVGTRSVLRNRVRSSSTRYIGYACILDQSVSSSLPPAHCLVCGKPVDDVVY